MSSMKADIRTVSSSDAMRLVGGDLLRQRQLRLPPQDGQGGLQLVRRVGGKLLHLLEHHRHPIGRRVQRPDQPAKLVVDVPFRDPLLEILRIATIGDVDDPPDRSEGDPRQGPASSQ
jgi:hypothetical protein